MHRHRAVADKSGFPIWHLADDTHRLLVQALLNTSYHLNVRYATVGIDNETHQHASLYILRVSIGGVSAHTVDEPR